ncbi:MAG: protein kinase [Alphaproteobacteria bacterium]|nr:protein kinase [Alphaproteobacteria bacterium]
MQRRVLGRYALGRPLKAGAVWLAEEPDGHEVIVKRLSGGLAEQARGELAALQVLDIPGVVRLLDDGRDEDGATVLVMQRARGRPFPAGARTWGALAPLLRRVLQVLREVHAAELTHRDLKPEHVLVDEAGQVTLLDFGLACGAGARLAHAPEGAVGTLRYAAPEQLLGGSRATARSDLYSLGLMAVEALTGALPHDADTEEALKQRRLEGHVSLPADLPDEALGLLRGLLERKPLRRIASADAALERLHDDALASFDAATAHWQGALERPALERLFAGPERLLHLRTDAAELLWRDHQGQARATREALRGWLRGGHARWQGGAVHVQRGALLRLGWSLPDEPERAERRRRLAGLLAEASWAEAAALALSLGPEAWRAGRLDEARDALAAGLLASSRGGDLGGAREAAVWLTVVGLASNSDRASALALQQLLRSPVSCPDLEALLRANREARAGELDRAETLLIELTEFEAEALDRWRPALRVRLAQRRGPAALLAALDEVEAWAAQRGSPTARADALTWRGLAAYASGDMHQAYALAGEALALKQHGTGRLSCRYNQVAALIELPELHESARRAASALVREAAQLRHAVHEACGEWALRTLAYRAGEATRPDWALVEATASLGSRAVQGQLWLGEAAIAWRAGDVEAAHRLANQAGEAWAGDGRAALPALARALALATASPVDTDAIDALLARGRGACAEGPPALPGVWLQALGVLLHRAPERRDAMRPILRELSAALPNHARHGRRELLSVQEILDG